MHTFSFPGPNERSESDSFEYLLDSCIAAIQDQGKTVEECLQLYPEQRGELEPLLRLVNRLQAARALTAPPEFRDVAAIRMQNLLAVHPRTAPSPNVPTFQRRASRPRRGMNVPTFRRFNVPARVVVSVFIAVFLLVSTGSVLASARALPGDLFYPLKLAVENAQLAVSPSTRGDAQLHLAFAARRLNEADALLQANRPDDLRAALEGYNDQVRAASIYVEAGSTLSPAEQAQLADLILVHLPEYQNRLNMRLELVPSQARAALERALMTSGIALDRATKVMEEWRGQPAAVPTATATQTPIPTSTERSNVPASRTPVPSSTWTPSPVLPTATPESVPQDDTRTPLPTSAASRTPTPSRHPPAATATPSPGEGGGPVPTWWPPDCPIPTEWPPVWPTQCPWPTTWPTPQLPTQWPTAWPTAWPTPLPTQWPTAVPPPEFPTDWPEFPTAWPEFPTAWPTIPGWPPP